MPEKPPAETLPEKEARARAGDRLDRLPALAATAPLAVVRDEMGKAPPAWKPSRTQKRFLDSVLASIRLRRDGEFAARMEVWARDPKFREWLEENVEGAFREKAKEVWEKLYQRAMTAEGQEAIRASELYLNRFDPPNPVGTSPKGTLALYFEIERERLRATTNLPAAP